MCGVKRPMSWGWGGFLPHPCSLCRYRTDLGWPGQEKGPWLARPQASTLQLHLPITALFLTHLPAWTHCLVVRCSSITAGHLWVYLGKSVAANDGMGKVMRDQRRELMAGLAELCGSSGPWVKMCGACCTSGYKDGAFPTFPEAYGLVGNHPTWYAERLNRRF